MSYLLVESVERLREKMRCGNAPLQRWWPHFMQLARHQSAVFPMFPSLVYLATEEREFAELARQRILAQVRSLPAAEYSIHVQFHTWCNTQPIARMAIAYDWVADSGVFTAEEQAEIAERFIDYAYKHPYLVAHSRIPTADNQIMSMAFGCAVIGHLFGQKRGSDARAREVFAYGVGRFPDFVGFSQPGGYSLEGSTYMDQIVMPSTALWAAFMEDITGEDHLSRRYAPSNACLREALEMDALMISPAGLQPPWDHYGFQRAMNKCGIAYLARKTGNYNWLALVQALDLWAEADHIAWGSDDKLWTLLWWPDDAVIPDDVDPFPSWVVPNTAAALDAAPRKLRWFQYWDRCAADYNVGRPQVNPNAIILEAYGSPLLVDGAPTKDCRHFAFPLEQAAPYMTPELMARTLQLFKEIGSEHTPESWLRGWTYGCIGGSNSIIIDDEAWYAPREEKEGVAVEFAATAALKAITSDAAAYYQPQYDVTTMRRTSVLVHDRYVLTRDFLAATAPHRWSWQVFTRPGTQQAGAGYHIDTAEAVRCDIVPVAAYPSTLQHVPGYIQALECAADLVQYHQHGAEASFAVGFFPASKLQQCSDLATGWQAGVSADGVGEWQGAVQQGLPVCIGDMPYFAPQAPLSDWRWLQQVVARPEGERIFIRLEKAVASARVWVNGQEITPPPTDGAHDAGDRLVPLVLDITDALQEGENLLALAAKPLRGKTFAGTIGLYQAVTPPPPPTVEELAPGCFRVTSADRQDLVLVDNQGAANLQGWETDAWCALLDAENGAALGATYCRGDGVLFQGTRAHIAWSPAALHCGDLSGDADLWCTWAGGHAHVESSGVIRISGKPGTAISWTADFTKPVMVNGIPAQPHFDALQRRYRVVITTEQVVDGDAMTARWNRAVALAWQPGEATRAELDALLTDPWWTVRCAAALSLGKRRERASVPALLQALQTDMARENYPPMAMRGDASDLQQPPADFLSLAGQEAMVKRWRVIMSCAIALGQIGDARAVPALCEILDNKLDFYPALANAALALGMIGDPTALPSLHAYADYYEVNAKKRAQEAITLIERQTPVKS